MTIFRYHNPFLPQTNHIGVFSIILVTFPNPSKWLYDFDDVTTCTQHYNYTKNINFHHYFSLERNYWHIACLLIPQPLYHLWRMKWCVIHRNYHTMRKSNSKLLYFIRKYEMGSCSFFTFCSFMGHYDQYSEIGILSKLTLSNSFQRLCICKF